MNGCTCYGIKYHKTKLNETMYILFPLTLVEEKSMCEMNNKICQSLDDAEYELLRNTEK